MSHVRKRLLISGRVQGVFFRDTCRREAQARGVAGHASNLADGRVEVVVEGERGDVDAVADWCHRGPPHADVASVEVIEEPPEGLEGFTIT